MSAAQRRKALLALRGEMTKALDAEPDRRKRKQIQREFEARIGALSRSQNTKTEETAASEETPTDEVQFVLKQGDISKAQLKKEHKERKRQEELNKLIEEKRANDLSHVEFNAVLKLLTKDHLKIHFIPSDGNCLYRALEHQLTLRPELPNKSHRELRHLAADQIESHKDEYFFFLEEQYQSEDGFCRYITQLRESEEWGGELEIRLISDNMNVVINVYTASEKIAYKPRESESPAALNISFHRHLMASAHYNSLTTE